MAHIKSHLGTTIRWAQRHVQSHLGETKKRRGALDWVPRTSCAAKKYIQYQVHPPFTSIYYYIHPISSTFCWKKRFQLCNEAKNGKIHENAKHTHVIPKHNSTCAVTQQLRRALQDAKNNLSFTGSWCQGPSRPLKKCNKFRPNQGKCCQTLKKEKRIPKIPCSKMTQRNHWSPKHQ